MATRKGRGNVRSIDVRAYEDIEAAIEKPKKVVKKAVKAKAVKKKVAKATEIPGGCTKEQPGSASQYYCWTLNNYTVTEMAQIARLVETENPVKYIGYGMEVGSKSKIPHLQGYMELYSKRMFKKFVVPTSGTG